MVVGGMVVVMGFAAVASVCVDGAQMMGMCVID